MDVLEDDPVSCGSTDLTRVDPKFLETPMTDSASLASWKPKFEAWTTESKALFAEGKGKKAFASYPWLQLDESPFHKLAKPVAESRLALLTTGGYSIEGEQEPLKPFPSFDDSPPGVREIPLDVDRAKLTINHVGYDHRFADEDHNVNLPLDRLQELVAAGEIGSLANNTQVVMGLMPNIAPLIEDLIPSLVAKFKSDSVEAALLVPS
jgi:D-proline reductase (dithiol) PrdB